MIIFVRLPLLVLLLLMPALVRAAEKPRLAMLIVVDQMTPSTLTTLLKNPALRKQLATATTFVNATHDHVPTETATGHSGLATGQPPSIHGIVSNDIYDRATDRTMPAVNDGKGNIGPFRLKARTLADAVRSAIPKSRVIALSFKDRGAIFLGGQQPSAAVWYDNDVQRFVTSPHYGQLPQWVAPANENLKGLMGTARPPFSPSDLRASPLADRALLFLSTQAIKGENLGADDACDLLLISFSGTDYVGHRWGPDSKQMAIQLATLSESISSLLEAARTASNGRFVAVITSDHGVQPVPESPAGRAVSARRITTREFVKGLEATFQRIHPAKGRKWIKETQLPDIYLNRELAAEKKIPWASFMKEAARELASAPDVAAVYIPGQSSGDEYARVFERSQVPGLSGDLQIRAAPNVLVTRWPTGTTHGSVYDYDTVVPAVFVGTGGLRETVQRRVSIESVARTLAAAMGVPFSGGEAAPLTEALPRR